MTLIYLDNNATTKPLPSVVAAMVDALGEGFGNPSSLHGSGTRAKQILDESRAKVAQLLCCRETEVVFTSCATESLNAALRGALAGSVEGKRRLLISAVEHEAIFEIAEDLTRHFGVEVVRLPVDEGGRLDLDFLAAELTKGASLVSLMLSNNETGIIFPVKQVAAMAKEAGVPVHVDAVQAVGKIPLDVEDLGVDYLSLSGHKFHAPKGVGVLFLRRGARYRSFVVGASQEGGRRGGTENIPGIAGLGAAAEHMGQGIPARRAHLSKLSARLEEGLLALGDVRLNGDPALRVPGTVNVSFKGIEGSAIVLTAARDGVCLSAGSACSAAQYGGSHVLEAMQVPFEYLYGAVRFSCCESTTMDDVERALPVVADAVQYLRSMTPTPPGNP